MVYVEVLIASSTFHGTGALTYSWNAPLPPGTIVQAPLRQGNCLGVILRTVDKPNFKVKTLSSIPNLPPLTHRLLQLMRWMQDHYPAPSGVIIQQFLPRTIPQKLPDMAVVATASPPGNLPLLTADQQQALSQIQKTGLHILHGETGTGKTRVYIELAQQSIAQGKSAIILTPEIGLTSQLSNDFRKVFGDRVVVVHSQLTEATRRTLWLRLLRQDEPVIVIGARSALFSPLSQVGLIAVDEAHDTAYKQDQAPYYHATRVAARLAQLHDCPVILGSATPLVADYFFAQAKHRPIIRMEQTARTASSSKAEVVVVDTKDRTQFTRRSHLSDKLIAAVDHALRQGDQALLFLNRRGTARLVLCEQCGWESICPHCDVPVIYHGDRHIMRCHTCAYTSPVPMSCPSCNNTSILFKSAGTKAVVGEVERLFPHARIQRFDADNSKEERIEQHYTALKNGEVDIIIGTQTLTKGLDLPRLGLVGIIAADASLYFPDFSAQERTYQLLRQVAGRVGRGHRGGSVIIQTYHPDSFLLQSIIRKDWTGFYMHELQERESFLFPPFCHLLKLTCRRATQQSAQRTAESLAARLHGDKSLIVEGPAPAFHEKIQNKYQWQLILKAKDRQRLVEVIRQLPAGWSHDIDPMDLL